MLLVHHGHAQPLEHHRFLDDGMGAHEDVDVACGQIGEYLGALFAFHHAREQFHPHVHAFEKREQGVKVLLGQYLCWGHDARLKAVVHGDEHGHKGHQCLARPYVAL